MSHTLPEAGNFDTTRAGYWAASNAGGPCTECVTHGNIYVTEEEAKKGAAAGWKPTGKTTKSWPDNVPLVEVYREEPRS